MIVDEMIVGKWLPIGSVVHLNETEGLVMVIAHMVSDADEGMLWDYAAVPYPQGLVSQEGNVFFDHEAIDGVFALGFRNEEGELYRSALFEREGSFAEMKRVKTEESSND